MGERTGSENPGVDRSSGGGEAMGVYGMRQNGWASRACRLAAVLLACAGGLARGDEPPALVFGMSTALTGPVADLGLDVRSGVLAAFAQANAQGGVHGRRLELLDRDDAYEPVRAGANVRELVRRPEVLAIVGNVGTPTAVVAMPIAVRAQVPFVGAYTGAELLRGDAPDPWVFNLRASYAQETGAMIDALINHARLRPEQIAFFTQRDAYGDSGFAGALAALRRHGPVDEDALLHARYERNTLAVEAAVADLVARREQVRAVVLVGAYAPCARFIRLARGHGCDPLFLSVSFVGTGSLIRELGDQARGVVVTQVVPTLDSDAPIVESYRRANAASAGEQRRGESLPGLEGYAVGMMLIKALGRIEGEPTRAALRDALEGMDAFDLGMGRLGFSPKDHQASHAIWPSLIEPSGLRALAWEELAGRKDGGR